MGKPKNPDFSSMNDDEKAAYLHEVRSRGGRTRSTQASMREARQRGGKTRSTQESMKDARSKGFWRTMELHPFFVRKHLRRRIKAQNRVRVVGSLILPRPMRRRRPLK